MPLGELPAAAGSLSEYPARTLAGTELVRVWRRHLPNGVVRALPWWFASAPADPYAGGRFDLPEPAGTCYLAETVAGAVLEAMQAHLTNLPVAELAARGAVRTEAPPGTPAAADLTDRVGVQLGLTAGVWAGADRPLTQRWAAAFQRDGWWALHDGIQHDLSATLRGVSLFDQAGEHGPTHAGPWTLDEVDLLDDTTLVELANVDAVSRSLTHHTPFRLHDQGRWIQRSDPSRHRSALSPMRASPRMAPHRSIGCRVGRWLQP